MTFNLISLLFMSGIVICITSVISLLFSWNKERDIEEKFRKEMIDSMLSTGRKMNSLKKDYCELKENCLELDNFYRAYIKETFLTDDELSALPHRAIEMYEMIKNLKITNEQHIKRLMKNEIDLEQIRLKLEPKPKRKYKKRVYKQKSDRKK